MGTDAISTRAGRYVMQMTGYRAFIPHPLPPVPPLAVDEEMQWQMTDAALALGRLDGLTINLPNPDLFLSMYVRKEALLSSQIEGTQASLEDVLAYEAQPGVQPLRQSAAEVVNYVRAMNHGLQRLESLPLSLRLVREIHRELLRDTRGNERMPGEFRTSQNWIGPTGSTIQTASFIPPPPHELADVLGHLETYLHSQRPTPILIKCALAHAQFETIHPFLDGNGRVGRLLITFLLCHDGALRRPLLYLSYFFKAHRSAYYDRLNAVRFDGDWEGWVKFFLTGVSEVARQAARTATEIIDLRRVHGEVIRAGRPRSSSNAVRLLEYLFEHPHVTAKTVSNGLRVSAPTANSLLAAFVDHGIVSQVTKQSWGRVFAYLPYIELLREGTEPVTS